MVNLDGISVNVNVDWTDTTNGPNISWSIKRCPACGSPLDKEERLTDSYIGMAWECGNCAYWESIE